MALKLLSELLIGGVSKSIYDITIFFLESLFIFIEGVLKMKANFSSLLSSLIISAMLFAISGCSQESKSKSEGGVAVKVKASKF